MKKAEQYHSRGEEYRKRYGNRYCTEWFMRVKNDENYYLLSAKIEYAKREIKKEMAMLVAASIAIRAVIFHWIHKWK